jgi:hypothetical protein
MLIGSAFIMIEIRECRRSDQSKSLFFSSYVSIETGALISKFLLFSGGLISIISYWITAIPLFCIYYLLGNYSIQESSKLRNYFFAWLVLTFVGILLYLIGFLLAFKNYPIINREIFISIYLLHAIPYFLLFFSFAALIILLNMRKIDSLFDQKYSILLSYKVFLLFPLLLVCISFYMSMEFGDPFLSTTTLVCSPFFMFVAFRRLPKDIIRSIRYSIFIFNIFALSYYPWLFMPLIIIYYVGKYYYWHRFDLHFPTLILEND